MAAASLMIATPCFGGMVTNAYFLSMLGTCAVLGKRNIVHEVVTAAGDSLITRARNSLVAVFMESSHSHLLFVDADIEWPADAVLRLLTADKDVICGAYPRKKLPPEYAVNLVTAEDGTVRRCPTSGAVQVMEAASGFLMIRRVVFEQMMVAFPERHYRDTEYLTPSQGQYAYALFDCMIDTVDGEPRYYSEDFGFCRRWRSIGGEVWLDPTIRLNHHGTVAYEGDPLRMFAPRRMANESHQEN
ncbi:MAG TPA: hypothetical protein VJR58_10040 [Vineibacter sp.]|nr:hypothetical protein [Vineibacter sp.]